MSISEVVAFKERPVNTLEASVEPPGPLYQGQCLEDLGLDRNKGLYGEEGVLQVLMPHVQVSPPMDIKLNPLHPETRS